MSNPVAIADLLGRKKIDLVVNDFYNRIQLHQTLAKPFSNVHDWPAHKEKITEFWWVVLGGKPKASFKYDPVGKHFAAGFTGALLADWKLLFRDVLQTHLKPDMVNKWFSRVEIIGDNLLTQDDRLHHE